MIRTRQHSPAVTYANLAGDRELYNIHLNQSPLYFEEQATKVESKDSSRGNQIMDDHLIRKCATQSKDKTEIMSSTGGKNAR